MPFVDYIERQLSKIDLEVGKVLSETGVLVYIFVDGHEETIAIMSAGRRDDNQTFMKVACVGPELSGNDEVDNGFAMYLLHRNAQLTSARWEVTGEEGEGEQALFMISAVAIAQSLDPNELREILMSIAQESRAFAKARQEHSIDF